MKERSISVALGSILLLMVGESSITSGRETALEFSQPVSRLRCVERGLGLGQGPGGVLEVGPSSRPRHVVVDATGLRVYGSSDCTGKASQRLRCRGSRRCLGLSCRPDDSTIDLLGKGASKLAHSKASSRRGLLTSPSALRNDYVPSENKLDLGNCALDFGRAAVMLPGS